MKEGLHIAVCVKIVPKPEDVKLKEDNTLDRANVENILNPSDKNAIEIAVSLKETYGGKITIVSMGPPFFDDFLRIVMAMGADDAVLLSDRAFAGSDTFPTTRVLAAGIKKLGDVDLVICGEESSDGGTGNVPPGVAEWLDWAQATYVHDIEYQKDEDRFIIKRGIEIGYEVVSIPRPAVISVAHGINSPRFPDFHLKQKLDQEYKIPMWNHEDLGLNPEELGLKGSYTTVEGLEAARSRERKREFIEGNVDEIVDKMTQIILEAIQKH